MISCATMNLKPAVIELDVGPASKCPLWVKSRHSHCTNTCQRGERDDSSCPLWVKSRHVQRKNQCPLYPRKRHQMRQMECLLWANSGHCGPRNAPVHAA